MTHSVFADVECDCRRRGIDKVNLEFSIGHLISFSIKKIQINTRLKF